MRGHWGRLVTLFGILAVMSVLYAIDPQLYNTGISLLIIVLPIAQWTVFAILLWSSRQAPDIESLAARVDDTMTLAFGSTIAAVVGGVVLGRVLGIITITVAPIVSVGLGFVLVAISLPAIGFLRTWRDVWLPRLRLRRNRRETR